ncbi:MAG: PKD domain-containing protein [Bacteriovorax sp.]|nr:PKD domain-containing protein [Bacteriovorax sp.]
MKYIIFLSLLILSFASQAAPSCSRNGTRVFYTNGVTTPRLDAQSAMEKIEGLGLNSHIDLKTVNYRLAYNYEESISKDFLEAAVQRFPSGYLKSLGVSSAYAAYMNFLSGGLSEALYAAAIVSITDEIVHLQSEWLLNYKNNSLYMQTVQEIKGHYDGAFSRGERIFAISHSQGGLFMSDVFDLIDEPGKHRFFSGFQIASPLLNEMNSHFGYATHDKDNLINFVRVTVGALPANVTAPLFVNNGYAGLKDYIIDYHLNHGLETTYLHDSTIRAQVITKLIEAAGLLESNCPKAIINYTKNNLQVSFDSTNPKHPNASGLTYFWDFGDGQTTKTSSKTLSHNYLSPGTYTVRLKVGDAYNNFDVTKVTFQVAPDSPNAFIGYTKNNLQVNFAANPLGPNETGMTYSWDFGDGQTATSKNPNYSYSQAGTYTVSLIVTNAYGVRAITSIEVQITIPPVFVNINAVINYNTDKFQLNLDATIIQSLTDLTYSWDFGDGHAESSSIATTAHTYENAGIFEVILTVSDLNGNTATANKSIIIIGDPPTLTHITAGREVAFTLIDNFQTSSGLSYHWTFGDGETLITTSKKVTHLFSNLLSKEISVKLLDVNSNEIYQVSDRLSDRSYSNLTYYIFNRNVRFNLESILAYDHEPGMTYSWSFGDGEQGTSFDSSITHTYFIEGTYHVSVNVYDKNGNLLFNETIFVLSAQENGGSSAGVPVTLEDGTSGESYLRSLLSPTTKNGFLYEYNTSFFGTCYVKEFKHFFYDQNTNSYGSGTEYVYFPLYNCTYFDVLPPWIGNN